MRFRVKVLRTCGDWAYAFVTPETPAGKPIDFAKTRYAERIENGVFDGPGTYALLIKGRSGWWVKEYAIEPTDLVWATWVSEYEIPRRCSAKLAFSRAGGFSPAGENRGEGVWRIADWVVWPRR